MATNTGAPVVVCGAINWDITLFADHLPVPGEEVTVTQVARVPGGTGANVAVAAARLLGPGQVGFVGAIGDDDVGSTQRGLLDQEGIVTGGLVVVPGIDSGHAFITVDSRTGQNVIASVLGANTALGPHHVEGPEAPRWLEGARFYAVTDPPLPVARALLARARTANSEVFWDPGVAIAQDSEAVMDIAADVDVLVLNEIEAQTLFGATPNPADLTALIAHHAWRCAVVLKLGSQGAVVLDQGGRRMTRVPVLPLGLLGLTVDNTVGGGDSFLGALVAMRTRGLDLPDAAIWASAAAGLKVSRSATRDSPTWKELQAAYDTWRAAGITALTTTTVP